MRAALALILGLAACGGGDSGPPADLLAELDALARGPNRAVAISSAFVAPGTILVGTADDTILTGIAARVMTETSGCGKPTQTTGSLAISFGEGCVLQTGKVTLSGTATITIARDGARITVLAMLDAAVDSEAFIGRLAIDTTDGNNFTVLALVRIGGYDFTVRGIPATPQDSAAAITTDGTTPMPGGGTTPRALKYTSVTQRFSACHPHGGSLRLESPSEGIDRLLAFADDTPQTDEATYTENGVATLVKLPHLASCPPLPQDE